jgi:hypothetical protein
MNGTRRDGSWSRRSIGRLILGAPFAFSLGGLLGRGAARAAEKTPPAEDEGPTPLAKLLAKEDGLSGDERDKVRKDVSQLERTLKTIRDFPLPNDVPPAGTFRALRSKRPSPGGRRGQ